MAHRSLWHPVQFTPLPLPPALQVYCDRLSQLYDNGKVTVVHAQAGGGDQLDELFDHFSWDRWLHSGLLEQLWRKEPFAAAIGTVPDESPHEDFASCTGYELAAKLAQVLGSGGAYPPEQPLTMVQAFDLAVPAAAALLPAPEDLALLAETPWCDYFYGTAWDLTVVTVCRETETVTALLATDAD